MQKRKHEIIDFIDPNSSVAIGLKSGLIKTFFTVIKKLQQKQHGLFVEAGPNCVSVRGQAHTKTVQKKLKLAHSCVLERVIQFTELHIVDIHSCA